MFIKSNYKLFSSITTLSFTFIVISIFLVSNLSAEQTTGSIRGSVFDSSGNPVSGASIQITHVPSGTKASTI